MKKKLMLLSLVLSILLLSTGCNLSSIKKQNELPSIEGINTEIRFFEGESYYIIHNDYQGEYDIQYIDLDTTREENIEIVDILDEFEIMKSMTYEEYANYCKKWGFTRRYNDEKLNYIVFSYIACGATNVEARLAMVEEVGNEDINLYIWDDAFGMIPGIDIKGYVIIVPTNKDIKNVTYTPCLTEEEFENIIEYSKLDPGELMFDKPIIYLYPEEEIEIEVKLGNKEQLTCSYPKYIDGWNVLAKPNGSLVDLTTNRSLYALYYESQSVTNLKMTNEGFVVKGENSAKFLEEKLAILGLNEREAEEFIVYWLPKLESNNYNYIRFLTEEEINENMPLNVMPVPDTTIRVIMVFKELDEPINVVEQKLNHIERNGFTIVEWGGSKI